MYNLSQLWTNSKWILLDGEYIRDISQNNLLLLYLLFFGSISISTFLFKTFFKENTLSLVITFFLYESQVLSSFSFVASRRITCKSLSEKTTKTLSSILYHRLAEIEYFFTLIPYHHWAKTELTYGKTQWTLKPYICFSKLNSLVGSNLIRE